MFDIVKKMGYNTNRWHQGATLVELLNILKKESLDA